MVLVHQDVPFAQPVHRVVQQREPRCQQVVVGRGGSEEAYATLAQLADCRDDVRRGEGHVLHPGAAVPLQEGLNLAGLAL